MSDRGANPYRLIAADESAEGLLITDLTRDDWHVIDAFEDDRYDLHQLQLADERYAWAYVYSATLAAPAGLWDSQHFTERHLTEYVRRCIAWRQRHCVPACTAE